MSALYILNYVEWTDVNHFQKIGQIHAERKKNPWERGPCSFNKFRCSVLSSPSEKGL